MLKLHHRNSQQHTVIQLFAHRPSIRDIINQLMYKHFQQKIIVIFVLTFCHEILGTGVPTALALKDTGSPSFTVTVVNRSTNFGAITSSFSMTFRLH